MAKITCIIILGLVALGSGKPYESDHRSSGALRQLRYELHRFYDSDRVTESEFLYRLFDHLPEDRNAGEEKHRDSDTDDLSLDGEQFEDESGELNDTADIVHPRNRVPDQQELKVEHDKPKPENQKQDPSGGATADNVKRKDKNGPPKDHPTGKAQPDAKSEGNVDSASVPSPGSDKTLDETQGNEHQPRGKPLRDPHPKDSESKKEQKHEDPSQVEKSPSPSSSNPPQSEAQRKPEAPLVQINVNVAPAA
ncbi:hypothetical protein ZHAS_00016046 [Anopheles sinensis]|uniref:Uncharacterized protein n=1 Tax=Anopheles sinensis TaxID=74873 RepID=A0A084WCY1_ANOSI|nr:hypothetical protein ZHAS_00016046 [Anopheles sinensis]